MDLINHKISFLKEDSVIQNLFEALNQIALEQGMEEDTYEDFAELISNIMVQHEEKVLLFSV
jgi:hypothetical protein